MRVCSGVLTVAMVLGGCRRERGPVRFDVEPKVVCSGDLVDVTWDAAGELGEPRLAIVEGTKAPTEAQVEARETGVPSSGTRSFPVAETTTFAFLLLASDPMQPALAYDQQSVEVVHGNELAVANTKCDSQTQVCTGTYSPPAAQAGKRVVRICGPTITRAGQTTPTQICVTHGDLVNTCISPDHPFETAVDAAGDWTLQVPRQPAGSGTEPPPPVLNLQLQLAGS